MEQLEQIMARATPARTARTHPLAKRLTTGAIVVDSMSCQQKM